MVPTASGRICFSQTSVLSSMSAGVSVAPAAISGFKNSPSGTSSNHPSTAPANSVDEMAGPTMNPTPTRAGEAAGDCRMNPPT